MNRNQVKVIIRLLKRVGEDGKPSLRRVFEQGGYLWATDGYVAIEIGEVQDELKGKCVSLEKLQEWVKEHKSKTDTLGAEMFEVNDYEEPDMVKLLHGLSFTPAVDPKFDIDILRIAVDYLGVKMVGLEMANNNAYLYRVKPLDEVDVLTRAFESKAYFMGCISKGD